MDCEQLIRLIKEWGLQVKQETMAIARMKLFVDQHIQKCPICAKDLIMPDELEKIYEYLVPGSSRIQAPIQSEQPAEDLNADETESSEGEEIEGFADEVSEDDEVEGEDDDV